MEVVGDVTLLSQMRRFASLTGKSVRTVCLETMRDWVSTLQRWIPPKNQAAGKKQIEKDLKRLYVDMSGNTSWDIPGKDNPMGKAWKLPSGAIVAQENRNIEPGMGAMRALYAASPRKQGRVRGGQLRSQFIGNHAMLGQMVVRNSQKNAMARERAKGIGRAKAGFNAALLALGGTIRGNWISRHGTQEGYIENNIEEDGSGYVIAGNEVPYARQKLSGEAEDAAMRAQGKALGRKIRYELRKAKEAAKL